MELSIVIPAYNEEQRIRPSLERYASWFAGRYGEGVELVVVANNCRDRTADVVRDFMTRYPCVRLIDIPEAVGKGGAIMRGFREARGAVMAFVDADGATPPEALNDVVETVRSGRADVVIASRWLPESKISPPQPLSRRIASRIFNHLVHLMFGIRVTDTQCGAKAFRAEAIRTVLPFLGITRWAFDVDLLFQCRRAGYRIVEIPTEWHDVAGSKVRVVRASTEMVVALTRLRLLYSPFRWVVRLYDALIGRWIHS